MATSACFNQSTQSLSPPLSALKMRAARSPPEAHKGGSKLEDHRGVSLCTRLEWLRVCGPVADGPRAQVLGWAVCLRTGPAPVVWCWCGATSLSPAPPSCVRFLWSPDSSTDSHPARAFPVLALQVQEQDRARGQPDSCWGRAGGTITRCCDYHCCCRAPL